MSPVITARSPFESIFTLTWPGVCPGVGSSEISSVIRWADSTNTCRPASTTGFTP
jgi:hypothetical protein